MGEGDVFACMSVFVRRRDGRLITSTSLTNIRRERTVAP